MNNKLLGWVALIGGLAAVIAEARDILPDTVASAANILALLVASIARPIVGPNAGKGNDGR